MLVYWCSVWDNYFKMEQRCICSQTLLSSSSMCNVGHARSSVRWLPGSLLSLTVRVHWPVLASVSWSAKRLGRLSRNVGKLCRICCARGSTFLSHVHSGLNRQDPVSWGISWAHSVQKIMVWLLLSGILFWSCCGLWPSFLVVRSVFCFCMVSWLFCRRWWLIKKK